MFQANYYYLPYCFSLIVIIIIIPVVLISIVPVSLLLSSLLFLFLLFQATFIHSTRGGKLLIDGQNPFREYHMGSCSPFTSVLFGGLSPHLEVNRWKVSPGSVMDLSWIVVFWCRGVSGSEFKISKVLWLGFCVCVQVICFD